MEDKHKQKLKSTNRLKKKTKKPSMEEMPELVEFKEKAKDGKLSKEETIEHLRNMMDNLKNKAK